MFNIFNVYQVTETFVSLSALYLLKPMEKKEFCHGMEQLSSPGNRYCDHLVR